MNLVLVIASAISFAHARVRFHGQVCAAGRVACPTHASQRAGQVVKLYNENNEPDNLMGETTTDESGDFEVCSTATDILGDIDSVLEIYTTCHNGQEQEQGCYRKLPFHISNNNNARRNDFFVDLSEKRTDETRKCLTDSELEDFVKEWTGKSPSEWLKTVTSQEQTLKSLVTTVEEKAAEIWSSITSEFS